MFTFNLYLGIYSFKINLHPHLSFLCETLAHERLCTYVSKMLIGYMFNYNFNYTTPLIIEKLTISKKSTNFHTEKVSFLLSKTFPYFGSFFTFSIFVSDYSLNRCDVK